MRIDHHLHTSRHSPDSVIDPLDLIEHARKIGLDGVVITEHDYQWELKSSPSSRPSPRPCVSSRGPRSRRYEGHFLVYGLPSLDEASPGIALAELLPIVRRHGAAIVAAHPFRWDQPFDAIIDKHGPAFDALELVSKNVTRRDPRRTAGDPRPPSHGRDRLERRPRALDPRLLLHGVRPPHRFHRRLRGRAPRP